MNENRTVARLISRIESGDPSVRPIVASLYLQGGRTPIVGVTGTPGAGKSTLIDGLLTRFRARGQRVAVLAVDPSSPFTGGAILGDRVRMGRHNTDPGVFIRSMAARGRLGGLARATGDALAVLDAQGSWDVIVVETVGVGQSEVDVLRFARTVVVVQTPAGGDALQAVKAGLLEVGDVFVVNKADLPAADRMVAAIGEMLSMRPHGADSWPPPVLKTQANAEGGGGGVDELLRAIDGHGAHLGAHPAQKAARERAQARALLVEHVAEALRERQAAAPVLEAQVEEVAARRCDPRAAAERVLRGA